MKTAMQTLLDDILTLMPRTHKVLCKKFELETFYLEKEKQQIIEAYQGFDHDMTAEDYFSETFS